MIIIASTRTIGSKPSRAFQQQHKKKTEEKRLKAPQTATTTTKTKNNNYSIKLMIIIRVSKSVRKQQEVVSFFFSLTNDKMLKTLMRAILIDASRRQFQNIERP